MTSTPGRDGSVTSTVARPPVASATVRGKRARIAPSLARSVAVAPWPRGVTSTNATRQARGAVAAGGTRGPCTRSMSSTLQRVARPRHETPTAGMLHGTYTPGGSRAAGSFTTSSESTSDFARRPIRYWSSAPHVVVAPVVTNESGPTGVQSQPSMKEESASKKKFQCCRSRPSSALETVPAESSQVYASQRCPNSCARMPTALNVSPGQTSSGSSR